MITLIGYKRRLKIALNSCRPRAPIFRWLACRMKWLGMDQTRENLAISIDALCVIVSLQLLLLDETKLVELSLPELAHAQLSFNSLVHCPRLCRISTSIKLGILEMVQNAKKLVICVCIPVSE